MATYVYRCGDSHVSEAQWPIGENPRSTRCGCGKVAHQVIGVGVSIAAAAMPNKKGSSRTIEIDNTEKQWDQDLPAYKRMRNAGLQPPSTRGAAALEERVGDQFDIDHGGALKHGSRAQVEDTAGTLHELGAIA